MIRYGLLFDFCINGVLVVMFFHDMCSRDECYFTYVKMKVVTRKKKIMLV
jgi:hypothetical protein